MEELFERIVRERAEQLALLFNTNTKIAREAEHLITLVMRGDGIGTAEYDFIHAVRHHPGITHRTGWHMHTAEDGWHYWITPTDQRFWQQRHQQLRLDPPPTGPTPSAT